MESLLRNEIKDKFDPFMQEILADYQNRIHSIHITGSALTPDYDPKHSDINSICVLHEMDLKFLEYLAPLGKKYGKRKLAAPLIMTPEYIQSSLDVFPLEFLNIKLMHATIFGEDFFRDLAIDISDLRHQCEREIKVRLTGLRQSYLSAAGNRQVLSENFYNVITGYIPLFRGVLLLLGKAPPLANADVLTALQAETRIETAVFQEVLTAKKQRAGLSIERLIIIFESFYTATDILGDIVNDFAAQS